MSAADVKIEIPIYRPITEDQYLKVNQYPVG